MRSQKDPIIRLKDYRVADYVVNHVDLAFKLEPEETRVTALMSIRRSKGVSRDTPLRFDGDELQLISVKLDGKVLEADDFKATPELLEINSLPKKNSFTLETEVLINPETNTKLMGLYRSNGKYCTQCEAQGFRRITYFPDRPDVLATYTTRIEADRDSAPVLLGNGNPLKTGKLANNRHFAIWHDPHPKPSYLFALVAGDLGSIHANFKTVSGNKVRLGIYVEPGKERMAEYAIDALIRSMKWDETVFGCEYDLDVFNIVAISDFNMGAMENKGLNVFNDKYILADPDTATDVDYANIEGIIAHEYFHNWTGNRITCRDWFQLCLKEGLTVYRDQEFSSDMRSRPVKRIDDVRVLRVHQFPEDAGPLAHAVRPETYREINNFYTPTVYRKGAEIVRMLSTILGKKNFAKGIKLYLKRHDGDAATIEDFLKCFSDASKTDLSQFALWYSQAGTPSVIASAHHDKTTKKLVLELEQNLGATPGQSRKKLMFIPLRFGLVQKDGADLVPAKITGAEVVGDVLHLKRRKQKIVFHGIDEPVTVSLNRNFSAPINLEMHQTKTDLAFLAANDSDAFNRWQAIQTYATKMLVTGARALARGKAPRLDAKFIDAATSLAVDEQVPAAFRALALTLPGEVELAQSMGRQVDPDAIHKARNGLMGEMGEHLSEHWERLWQETEINAAYLPDAEQSGKRALRNLALDLGVTANFSHAEKASLNQFSDATNMTDRFAAFSRIISRHKSGKDAKRVIAEFYTMFEDNALVLDKWFIAQSTAPGPKAASSIRALTKHEKFNFTNPNRIQALLGSFAFGNPTGFNAANGMGYRLICEMIGKIDGTNPQVAARLLTAFRSIGVMEATRKNAAMNALRRLRENQALSKDVSEILDRTLAG